MLEGIIALVVIGTIGYFMWQKSKKSTESEAEPSAPYKVEAPVVAETSAPAPVDKVTNAQEAKPKAKKAPATKKPKIEKVKAVKAATDPKPKAPKKPKIQIAK